MKAKELARLIRFVLWVHDGKAKKHSKRFRKWDGKTPYGIHPIWCAMTILTETGLPEDIRISGAQALLLHDILEDTTADLPNEVPDEVVKLVREMTFDSSEEEMKLIWRKSKKIKLLKLYDKVSNLLDGSWMSSEKRERYLAYVKALSEEVESHYGELNITKIARALTAIKCLNKIHLLSMTTTIQSLKLFKINNFFIFFSKP